MTYYLQIKDGVVVNRTISDKLRLAEWSSEGQIWEQDDEAQIGWTYDGKNFSPPPREPDPEPTPTARNLLAEIDELRARLDKIDGGSPLKS